MSYALLVIHLIRVVIIIVKQICDIVEEVGLVRSGPDREVLSNVKAQVVLPEHSVVNESRWCVSDRYKHKLSFLMTLTIQIVIIFLCNSTVLIECFSLVR